MRNGRLPWRDGGCLSLTAALMMILVACLLAGCDRQHSGPVAVRLEAMDFNAADPLGAAFARRFDAAASLAAGSSAGGLGEVEWGIDEGTTWQQVTHALNLMAVRGAGAFRCRWPEGSARIELPLLDGGARHWQYHFSPEGPPDRVEQGDELRFYEIRAGKAFHEGAPVSGAELAHDLRQALARHPRVAVTFLIPDPAKEDAAEVLQWMARVQQSGCRVRMGP